ncbi:MAG: glycosyltransferase [Solirubrobacterales bacterium]|nr:glycosyltransferase [Solirubrobacterales bacterium]
MSIPAVSIITALADRAGHRLVETYDVLVRARTRWEWLIQLDGPARDRLPETLLLDERVRVEVNGLQLGIATTRNRALARAAAPLLLNADSDDVPTVAALDGLAPAFQDASVGLAFGDWIELWPDRAPWTPEVRFAPGRLEPGALSRIWSVERWVPLHLAGAMWRTDAVLAAGGWSATVGGSDIGLMLGVDVRWASVYVPVTTFTYHHHARQVTASHDWQSQFDRDMRFLARRQRALAAFKRSHPV